MPRKLLPAATAYALCLLCAFFFFRSYVHTLTTQVLLTGDQLTILRSILNPVLLLAGTVCLLTIAMGLRRWPFVLPLLSTAFLLSLPLVWMTFE